jgi:nitroreductase
MPDNPVLDCLLQRKSIRKYTDTEPDRETVETVVRAGQQAPFASQMCSVVFSRRRPTNPFKAPLYFVICFDAHRLERFMALRGWTRKTCDLYLFLLGLQDAAYLAQNMVIAAESLGMGSCFLGAIPTQAAQVAKRFLLPQRVFPLVGLTMGYPAENPPTRPRFPLDFTLFEDRYPELSDEAVTEAMRIMDEGYLAQDYYRRDKLMLPLENDRPETYDFDTYSWTEHISRKWGQWIPDPAPLLEQLRLCGFDLSGGPAAP